MDTQKYSYDEPEVTPLLMMGGEGFAPLYTADKRRKSFPPLTRNVVTSIFHQYNQL